MPYIKQEARESIVSGGVINPEHVRTPGDLNFALTALIKDYIRNYGLNYQRINDVLGALEGAKIEFYRKVVAPYEDTKIVENGDVPFTVLSKEPEPKNKHGDSFVCAKFCGVNKIEDVGELERHSA